MRYFKPAGGRYSYIFITALLLCLSSNLASSAYAKSPAYAEIKREHETHKKNHISIITGATHVPEEDLTAFTIGLDFERELTENIGVGFVVERALGELEATSIFAVTDIHLGQGFVIQAGPGLEFVNSETLAVGRIGLFYEIDIESQFGDIILAPSFSYDISEAEDSLVFGLAFGTKF